MAIRVDIGSRGGRVLIEETVVVGKADGRRRIMVCAAAAASS